MKAAIFEGPGKVSTAERPKPKIKNATDVIVRVVLACVCGSDLWFYRGESDHPEKAIGHEFIGVVEETGPKVKNIKQGDFVISLFKYFDNTCTICKKGMTSACLHGGFYNDTTGGGQGEYIRVPQADGTLIKVPGEDFSNEMMKSLLTLSDVMCTGHHAAVCAEVKPGDTVAVVGDGAVGLCAVIAAKRLGAKRIIAMSRHAPRQKLAKEFGATDIVEERGRKSIDAVKKRTEGIGADAVMECVGTGEAMDMAIGMARAGAMVGVVGVPHGVELPMSTMFGKNVGVHGGSAAQYEYLVELLKDVLDNKIHPGRVFDFETDLDGIAEAYAKMDQRQAIKSMLKVSEI
jgi:threonine dehydrogenase-like Zn-dependent dehydrogenase